MTHYPVRTELVEVRGTLRQAQGERCGMLPFDKLRANGVGCCPSTGSGRTVWDAALRQAQSERGGAQGERPGDPFRTLPL